MRGRSVIIAATAFAAGLFLAAPQAMAKCRVDRLMVPVTLEASAAFVDTKVNDVDARFGIDTSYFYSAITPDAARRMHLVDEALPRVVRRDHTGKAESHFALAKTVELAGVPMENVEFEVTDRPFGSGAVGLLGGTALSRADLEFDFAKGKMGFLTEQDCHSADLAFWANGGGSVIPLESNTWRRLAIFGRAKLNGHTIGVEIDPGSPTSILSLAAAARLGIRTDSPGVKRAGLTLGIGSRGVETWIVPVESFVIGQEEIKNTELRMGKLELWNNVDMILGFDFFLAHHIIVARSRNQLYFTYNGGPVFRLDEPEQPNEP